LLISFAGLHMQWAESEEGSPVSIMTNNAVLSTLKLRLTQIARALPNPARVFLVDYPLHANIGDLLIHLGEERFFVEHGFEVAGRFTYHDYVRPSSLGADDVFIFSGGGNVGDL
jgi:pyruvyl transferase EpsO